VYTKLRTNTDCRIAGTVEVCRLTSFRSVKPASPTAFSIHHSEQWFIPPLITVPQGKHAGAPVSNLETNPHSFL